MIMARRSRYYTDAQVPEDAGLARARRSRKIVTWLWVSFLSLGTIVFLLLLLIYNGVIGYMPPIDELEDPHDNFASILYASDGSTELGRYYESNANRENVEYSQISPNVIHALIATEDVRFREHSGIDFMALGRTGVKTVLMGDRSSGGASTITQQLAKILYSKRNMRGFKRMLQKPIEWMIAIKLERVYTKEELIKMYLNRFDFLNNAVGIKTAAAVYFNKLPSQLDVPQAAMLIGMLKNPSYFNPLRYPDRTLGRRNTVIDQMVKAGFLSAAEADIYKSQPLGLDYHHVVRNETCATYLREEIRRVMCASKPERPSRSKYKSDYAYKLALGKYNTDSLYWADDPLYGWIEKNPRPDGEKYDLFTDGLKIYTTIDTRMQEAAEAAVYEQMGGVLQPAFFAEKRGMPYSTDTRELSVSQRNRLIEQGIKSTARYRTMKEAGASEQEIKQAFNTPRQMRVFAYVKQDGKYRPGSKDVTMTPRDSMLYMKTILRIGMVSMDPHSGYVKAYVGGPDYNYFQYDMAGQGRRQIGSTAKPFLYTLAMEQDYTPCSTVLNAQPNYGGWAPRSSSGGRAGQMVELKWALTTSNNWISARLTADLQPANLANKMRLFGLSGLIEPTMPLCLGPNDVSVLELVGAYTAFPGKGIRTTPVLVTRIEDEKGNVIYNAVPHRTEVMSETAAMQMITMLMSVVDHGTGSSIRGRYGITAEMGGKTGTTNYNADMWFVGFTPQLVTGIWVGGEERFIHFLSMAYGQGARAALPIYGSYMKRLYADRKLPYTQDAKFEFPADFTPCDGPDYWSMGGSGDAGPAEDPGDEEIVAGALE